MTTSFIYDPEFQTIIKYQDDKEIGRLSARPDELEPLGEYLWDYLKLRKFIVLIDEVKDVEAPPGL